MSESSAISRYFETVADEGAYLCSSIEHFRRYIHYVFEGTALGGCRMLDVGAGAGVFGFYAAAQGARQVICLEPEAAGSSAGLQATHQRLCRRLDTTSVELHSITLQQYTATAPFDVVLLHNSINHLDEPACVALHRDPGARQAYLELLGKLADLCAPGARLIITDCSSRNLFASLGRRNPFAPSIEWEKHQPPGRWAKMLGEVGFRDPRVRWSTFGRLGRLGHILLGNAPVAFLLASHFRLTMHKPGTAT